MAPVLGPADHPQPGWVNGHHPCCNGHSVCPNCGWCCFAVVERRGVGEALAVCWGCMESFVARDEGRRKPDA